MKRLSCIYNAGSGSAESKRTIEKLFSAKGYKIDFLDIKSGGKELSKRIKQGPYTAIIAAGGDGTVRQAAQLAIDAKLPLGVLPVGTLNHFAKDLGLPLDLEQAVGVITSGSKMKIDYCTVNENVYVNNASIGIYPATVLGRGGTNSRAAKILATTASFTAALFSHKVFRISLTTPQGNWEFRSPLLFVDNNKYQVDKPGFTSRAELNGGKMFVYIVRANRRRTLLLIALLSFIGMRSRKADFISLTEGPVIMESARPSAHVSLDGEIFKLDFPLRFQLYPGKLRVYKST